MDLVTKALQPLRKEGGRERGMEGRKSESERESKEEEGGLR